MAKRKNGEYDKPSWGDRILYRIVSGKKLRIPKGKQPRKDYTGSTQFKSQMSNLSGGDYKELMKHFGKKK